MMGREIQHDPKVSSQGTKEVLEYFYKQYPKYTSRFFDPDTGMYKRFLNTDLITNNFISFIEQMRDKYYSKE